MDPHFEALRVTGQAVSLGGDCPHPPFHDYPLLAWQPQHPKYGSAVHTEDQLASVQDVATSFSVTPDLAVVAARFGTTEEHARQAVAYAARAGYLAAGGTP